MKKLFLASALTALTFAAAHAADAVGYEPVQDIASPAYDWSGVYIGAQAGYGWGDSRYDNSYTDYANYDPKGFLGGIYGGYNYQLQSNLVLGIDADIAWTGMGQREPFFYEEVLEPDMSVDSDVKWSGAIRARLGFAIDRWMPYVAGGYSVARYEFSLSEDGDTLFSESKTMNGWNIGAGVEYAATDNILVRAEYRYSDFGKKNLGNLWDGEDWSTVNLKSHDIRIGLAYKF
jgi:outer membrane immunogenic protein